jgi:hypothetical protein
MLSKKVVLKTIEELPDEFSVNDLFDRIVLLQKIQQASQEIKEGKGVTTDEAKEQLKKWLN